MKRWWSIVLGASLAYGALRYWPTQGSAAGAALTASALLLLGWWLGAGARGTAARSWLATLRASAIALSSGCLLSLFFLHAPAALDDVSEQVITVLMPSQQRQIKKVEQQVNKPKPRSGNWLWNEQTIRPLPRRANLKPGNQPEVFLQLENPADAPKLLARRAYVGAFALGTYADASWSLTPADTANPPAFPARPGALFRYEIFHPNDPSGQTPLCALQGMIDADIAPLSYRGDGILLLPPSDGPIGYRYRARSRPLSVEDLDDTATAATRTSVPPAWLELPDDENLVIGIRGLNAENITAGSLKQQLLQVRDGLQQECRYSLDIDNPDNRDPLTNFLFHEKRGHCELFATAGVMAARALGVPARIAYGWTGGSYYETSNLFVFRAREAHAWTEVLIADVGWVVLDCTPPASIGNSRAAPPGETPLAEEENETEQEAEMAENSSLGVFSAVLGMVTLVCAVLALLLSHWSKRGVSPSADGSAAAHRPAGYYRAFVQLCQKRRITIKPHLTLRQLLRKFPEALPFAALLQRYHYQTRYGQSSPDPTTEAALKEQIRRSE